MTLKVAYPGPQNLVSDWARIFFMSVIFLYGALFFLFPGYRESLDRNMGIAFIGGGAIFLLFVASHLAGYGFSFGYNPPFLAQLAVKSLATLCWLIAFPGFAQRYPNFGNRILTYASDAALPFYILHQTVIIALGFYIVGTDYSLIAKYASINIFSFLLTIAIYDTTIKRFALFRFLFGMRPRRNNHEKEN